MAVAQRGTGLSQATALPRDPASPSATTLAQGAVPRQRVVAAVELTGIASLAVRDLLNGPRREGQVIATVRGTVLVEFPGAAYEPKVIAVCGPEAIRLPNAVIAVAAPPSPATVQASASVTDLIVAAANPRPVRGRLRQPVVYAGGGMLRVGGLTVRARRWWDPSPVVGPLSRTRLDRGATALGKILAATRPADGARPASAGMRPTMASQPDVKALAACCASGDLAGAVEHAEVLVGLGLGPGILPGGDSVICGMLLALRLLGGAIPGGTRAVWLADWLSAAVTGYARQRTTPLAASLLHCASEGQAAAEVAAVLHCIAGEEPLEPAARALLMADASGTTTTADLAWGLVAGCRAAQVLSVS
jgi:hypothetical protein